MVGGHATSFRATKLSKNCADADIVNLCGIEVGELLDCSFQDLLDGQIRSTNAFAKTYGTEQFVVICIAQTSLLRPGHRSSQCGKNDHIIGVLLENVLDAFLDERHCECRKSLTARLGIQDTFEATNDQVRKIWEASGKNESRCSPRREAMVVMLDAPTWSFRQLDAGRKCCKTAAVKTSPATLGRKRLGYWPRECATRITFAGRAGDGGGVLEKIVCQMHMHCSRASGATYHW